MNGAILLRPKHRDLARQHFRCQRWRSVFFELPNAFLNALQPVERTLQPILCRTADRGARWFFPALELLIQSAAYNARISGFRITKTPRFMDLIAAQTKISGCRNVGRLYLTPTMASHFASRLRGIIFIRQPAFGGRFDFQCIGLRAMRCCDQIVMGSFGVFQTRSPFGDIVGKTGGFAGFEHLGGCLGASQHRGGAIDEIRKVSVAWGDWNGHGHFEASLGSIVTLSAPALTVRAGSKACRIGSGQAV